MGRLLCCLSAVLLTLVSGARAEGPAGGALPPGPVQLQVRSLRSGLVLQRVEAGGISTVCVPPCERQLQSGDLLRVAGLRRLQPQLFVLRIPGQHRGELVVTRSYSSALAYALTGLGLLGVSAVALGLAHRVGDLSGEQATYGLGGLLGAVGLGLSIYGVVLFTRPRAAVAALRDLGPL